MRRIFKIKGIVVNTRLSKFCYEIKYHYIIYYIYNKIGSHLTFKEKKDNSVIYF